jgi:hypothetical protein
MDRLVLLIEGMTCEKCVPEIPLRSKECRACFANFLNRINWHNDHQAVRLTSGAGASLVVICNWKSSAQAGGICVTASIDFLMTYPAFVALRPDGVPYTFTADGDCSIALFTDEDLLLRFFCEITPQEPPKRLPITHRDALCYFLSEANGREVPTGQKVTHVVIDPTITTPRSRVHAIEDFLAHLARNE